MGDGDSSKTHLLKKKLQPKQPLPHLMALQLSSLATSKGKKKHTHNIIDVLSHLAPTPLLIILPEMKNPFNYIISLR
jgi:hypothetical protein